MASQSGAASSAADPWALDGSAPGAWVFDENCITRFPEDIAEKIHAAMETDEAGDEELVAFEPKSGSDEPLAAQHQHRYFKVSALGEELHGVLVDLPCFGQTMKTVDGVNLYTTSDVTQMLLVYREGKEPKGLKKMQKEGHFLWPDGITPPTRKIRETNFMREDMWKPEDLTAAEQNLVDVIDGAETAFVVEGKLSAAEAEQLKKDLQEKKRTGVSAGEVLWDGPRSASRAPGDKGRAQRQEARQGERQAALSQLLDDSCDSGDDSLANSVPSGFSGPPQEAAAGSGGPKEPAPSGPANWHKWRGYG